MRIETEAERARISETLVNLVGLRQFWSWVALEEAIRPVFDADEPRRRWQDYAAPWSSGQARMVAVAWGVWNDSHASVGVGDLMFGLDTELRQAIADLLLLSSSSEWLDKHRAGWSTERISHYTVGRWEVPQRGLSYPVDPYWVACGVFAQLDAAKSTAAELSGRVRVQLITGLVKGPKARELIEEREE